MENKEIVIWGLPSGSTDPIDEEILSTRCKTVEDIEKIKSLATANGWHSIRVVNFDMCEKPNFTKGIN